MTLKVHRKHRVFNVLGDMLADMWRAKGGTEKEAELWRWFAGHAAMKDGRNHEDFTPEEEAMARELLGLDGEA